ncbi:MAG: CvpA family protein [Clostridia bacterium]|nr:CvpA family protein [Clostridia bacterium]MBR6745513.1 CvpA family protein [Clostridia bacterium]
MAALIVDIALVAVLAICVFFGWKNGFIKAISKFLTYVLSFAIANFCWKFVAPYIGRIPFIKNLITEGVEGPVFEEGATFMDKFQTMLAFFTGDMIQNGNVENSTAVMNNYLAEMLTMVISFALVFIAAMLILKLVFRLLNAVISKIPVIKQVNGILGAVMGFLNGSIWTWVIANVFVRAFLPTLNQINPTIFTMEIAESFIITLCTKINPITYIFQFINWISSLG